MQSLIEFSMIAPIRIICFMVFLLTALWFVCSAVFLPHGDVKENAEKLQRRIPTMSGLILAGFTGGALGGLAFIAAFVFIKVLLFITLFFSNGQKE